VKLGSKLVQARLSISGLLARYVVKSDGFGMLVVKSGLLIAANVMAHIISKEKGIVDGRVVFREAKQVMF